MTGRETNTIRQHREALGMSQEQLGERIGGMDKHKVSRIEKGETKLTVEDARRFARALGVPVSALIGEEASSLDAPPGFSDDLVPYDPGPTDPLASLRRDNVYLFEVDTDVLDAAGLLRGTIVEINDSRQACARVTPLQPVRVRMHPPEDFMKPVSLLRLYVPPRLLITNSRRANLPSINMDDADAHIVGVVVGMHRRLV